MSLGADIIAKFNTLTEAQKKDFEDCWNAIGELICPTGKISPYGGNAVPDGYLMCDGSAISRTTYADLFAIIGTTFGVGDGATTFNVPDFRGIFPSGAGANGTLTDANGAAFSRTLGTYQNDKFQEHHHTVYGIVNGETAAAKRTLAAASSTSDVETSDAITDGVNGNPRTGAETNPANLAVNFIIKT